MKEPLSYYLNFVRGTPGSKNYWSDIEVTSTQYNLNIAPMVFAAWNLWGIIIVSVDILNPGNYTDSYAS